MDRHRDSRQIHHKTEDEASLVACCEDVRKFKIQYINAKKSYCLHKLYISEVLIDFVTSTMPVVGSTSNRY